MKVMTRIALVALAGSVVAGFGVAPAGATYPGSNGLVAFVTTRAGFPEIYTVDPANGVEHNLSNGTAESTPAWNPYGTKIAFTRGADVWVMKANGTGRVDLTASDPLTDSDPTWSPDGRKIAFSSDRDTSGRTQIYVMNANGSHVVRLTNDTGFDSDPQWSPDGKHILFVSNVTGNLDIWSMRANGASPANLTAGNTSDDGAPSWSPDGAHIVFASGRPHPGSVGADLFIMDADGANVVAFNHETNGYSDGGYPAFSPDGTEIVFSANNGGGSLQLWLVSSAGGLNVHLTTDTGAPANVGSDWQPIVPPATLAIRPHSGVPGTTVKVTGAGFAPGEKVKLTFTDSAKTKTAEPVLTAAADGTISTTVAVPAGAVAGKATFAAVGVPSGLTARKAFTVTSPT
jgi:Tol biopolymer transport system component